MSYRGVGLAFLSSCLLLGGACKPPPISSEGGSETDESGDGDGDSGDGDGDTGDGDGDGDGTGDGDGDPVGCVSALDILLVVDNSGSMGEAQALLAGGISGLIDPLDAAGVDWRIGITTTDAGNPWCPAGTTTPEAGNLVLSSCRSRINDFLFNNGDIDATDLACNDLCPHQSVATTPTTTAVDPTPTPRPWVEKIDGVTNLEDNLDPAEALACLVPQGINGCGFESQLESSYLAITRTQISDEQNYGFLRSDASLLVVIVTDEVDCSYNKDWSAIFDQDGNKVFWSDPAAAFPTSAVCWNAGVQCTGDPSSYDSCDPVNKDVDGNAGASDAEAVLRPVTRYIGLLDGLEQQLQNPDPTASVRLSVIGGVAADGTVTYADSPDSEFQDSFGIGPGCVSGEGTIQGLPPVRMRAVSGQSGGVLKSVCADGYASTLSELVEPFIATCG